MTAWRPPLTKDISDKGRQDLAYSMLYHMAEAGATVTVDGKQVDFDADDLCTVSRFGDGIAYGKGRLDPEWYGANKDNYSKGDLRSVAHMTDDYTLVRLAPDTASPRKADEMFNFLATSLDKRLYMSIPDADGNLSGGRGRAHPDGAFRQGLGDRGDAGRTA